MQIIIAIAILHGRLALQAKGCCMPIIIAIATLHGRLALLTKGCCMQIIIAIATLHGRLALQAKGCCMQIIIAIATLHGRFALHAKDCCMALASYFYLFLALPFCLSCPCHLALSPLPFSFLAPAILPFLGLRHAIRQRTLRQKDAKAWRGRGG